MGCDIHVFLEFRIKKPSEATATARPYWDSFTWQPINPGRNYELFSKLSGVRGEPDGDPVATFGWPDDVSWAAKEWNSVRFNKPDGAQDPARVSQNTVDGWVKNGSSRYIYDEDGNVMAVTHPDWHSHSHCDLKSLQKALRGSSSAVWQALIAAAKSFEKNGYEVRFLLAYDN